VIAVVDLDGREAGGGQARDDVVALEQARVRGMRRSLWESAFYDDNVVLGWIISVPGGALLLSGFYSLLAGGTHAFDLLSVGGGFAGLGLGLGLGLVHFSAHAKAALRKLKSTAEAAKHDASKTGQEATVIRAALGEKKWSAVVRRLKKDATRAVEDGKFSSEDVRLWRLLRGLGQIQEQAGWEDELGGAAPPEKPAAVDLKRTAASMPETQEREDVEAPVLVDKEENASEAVEYRDLRNRPSSEDFGIGHGPHRTVYYARQPSRSQIEEMRKKIRKDTLSSGGILLPLGLSLAGGGMLLAAGIIGAWLVGFPEPLPGSLESIVAGIGVAVTGSGIALGLLPFLHTKYALAELKRKPFLGGYDKNEIDRKAALIRRTFGEKKWAAVVKKLKKDAHAAVKDAMRFGNFAHDDIRLWMTLRESGHILEQAEWEDVVRNEERINEQDAKDGWIRFGGGRLRSTPVDLGPKIDAKSSSEDAVVRPGPDEEAAAYDALIGLAYPYLRADPVLLELKEEHRLGRRSIGLDMYRKVGLLKNALGDKKWSAVTKRLEINAAKAMRAARDRRLASDDVNLLRILYGLGYVQEDTTRPGEAGRPENGKAPAMNAVSKRERKAERNILRAAQEKKRALPEN